MTKRIRQYIGILAALYYITIALLLLDPLYLSVLCGLFGGGDMNGIALLLPEWARKADIRRIAPCRRTGVLEKDPAGLPAVVFQRSGTGCLRYA